MRARRLLEADEYSLDALGAAVGFSPGHLQRCFRAQFGISPAQYRAQVKLASLKQGLRESSDVTRAVVDAGYGSPSRVCAVALGDEEARLLAELRAEFPKAAIERVQAGCDEFLPRVCVRWRMHSLACPGGCRWN